MVGVQPLLRNILLFMALLVPGFLLGRQNKLPEAAVSGICNILTDVAMPFLVFLKLLETDLHTLRAAELLCCVLIPLGLTLLLYGGVRLFFRDRAAQFCAVFPNCGFLAIPLASALFPEHPEVTVFVSLFNVFSTFMLLTLGVGIISGGRGRISLRRAVISPVTVAIAAGLACSLLAFKPTVVLTYTGYFAQLTTALSMVVLGVQLAGLTPRRLLCTGVLYPVALVKLILAPLAVLGVLLFLRCCGCPVSGELASAMLLSSGVSTAATAPAMAQRYGADGGTAAVLTLGTTLLCAVTLPAMSLIYGLFF